MTEKIRISLGSLLLLGIKLGHLMPNDLKPLSRESRPDQFLSVTELNLNPPLDNEPAILTHWRADKVWIFVTLDRFLSVTDDWIVDLNEHTS